RPDSVFERDGDDLYCEIPITFAEATLGAEIDIPTLEGTQKYTIPEGTQTGTVFTLRNKGVTRVNNPKVRGNLYLTVTVEVPKNLSKESKELLRQFADSCDDNNNSKHANFFQRLINKIKIDD
ncbi:MAG: molecular chaperone DnaJ, partial [Clostridia bacterium]|nr:molecular chaperone DnaJ [Clostridia bacterium]